MLLVDKGLNFDNFNRFGIYSGYCAKDSTPLNSPIINANFGFNLLVFSTKSLGYITQLLVSTADNIYIRLYDPSILKWKPWIQF